METRSFISNVFKLLAGNGTAQLISFIFLPVITRLYTSEDIGVQNFYVSAIVFMAPLLTLGLHQAIPMAKNKSELLLIYKSCILSTIYISFLIFIFVCFFNSEILKFVKFEPSSLLVVFFPFCLVVVSYCIIIEAVSIRNMQYSNQSKAMLSQSVVTQIIKLMGGFTLGGPTFLIVATVFGYFSKSYFLFIKSFRFSVKIGFFRINNRLYNSLKSYSSFPKFCLPQIFLSSISVHAPVFYLAHTYSFSESAYYGIAAILISVPVVLFGNSVGNVFYPKYAQMYNAKPLESFVLLKKTTIYIFYFSVLPFLIFLFMYKSIFTILFGSEWVSASEYAVWMSFQGVMMLISKPALSAIPVLGLNYVYLKFEVANTIVKMLVLYFGTVLFSSSVYVIACYSMVSSVFYLSVIFLVIRSSGRR